MKARPILFSAPMVRAILAGRKTQTRRLMNPQPLDGFLPVVGLYHPSKIDLRDGEYYPGEATFGASDGEQDFPCPYGQRGDRFWVKETWKPDPSFGYPPKTKPTEIAEGTNILYRATLPEDHPKFHWNPWMTPLFQRQWMSRISLEIVSIRAERVQDITEEDAMAEGTIPDSTSLKVAQFPHTEAFMDLWDSINADRGHGWDHNKWVWVIQFKEVK